MKQAMYAKGDFDLVFDFLNGIATMVETGLMPDNEEDEADDSSFSDWVETKFAEIEDKWQRVLWAGKVALDNACDPTAKTVEWKPEIAAALKAAGLD